jgi:hypothetical protein
VGGGEYGFSVRRGGLLRGLAIALLAAGPLAACAAGGVDLLPPDLPSDETDASSADTSTPSDDDSSLPPAEDSGQLHDAAPSVFDAGSPDVGLPLSDAAPQPSVEAAPPPEDSGPPPEDASLPDSAPDAEIDSGIPETSIPDVHPVDSAAPSDSSVTPTCNGLPEWFAGITATEVQHFGEKYSCLVSGWCTSAAAVAAYEPGKGWAWMQAWSDEGPCPASVADAGDAGHP